MNGNRKVERGDIWKTVDVFGEELLGVEDLVSRMLFEVRTTSSRINDDRNVWVERRVDALGEPLAVFSEPSMRV